MCAHQMAFMGRTALVMNPNYPQIAIMYHSFRFEAFPEFCPYKTRFHAEKHTVIPFAQRKSNNSKTITNHICLGGGVLWNHKFDTNKRIDQHCMYR